MVRDHGGHLQVICDCFGKLHGESDPTVGEDGCITERANEWAKMMEADLLQLAETESGGSCWDL